MHFCQSRMTIFLSRGRFRVARGQRRQAGREAGPRRGRLRPRFTHGTGFPPHRPRPAVILPCPPASYKRLLPSFRAFRFVFLSAAINRKRATLTQTRQRAPAQSCPTQPGRFRRGEAPQGRFFPSRPLTRTRFPLAGRGEPGPNPKGRQSPVAGTEAFPRVLRRGARFFALGQRGEGEPLLALPQNLAAASGTVSF